MIKIEIPFNKEIYIEQNKLNFDTAWSKHLKKNKTNATISIILIVIGILIIIGKNNIGGLMCAMGLFRLYMVYRMNVTYKENKKIFFEAISNELKTREDTPDTLIWEFHDDYFAYQDYQQDLKLKWMAIMKYTRIDETIFVDSKVGIRFMLSEKEVGKEKFEEIIAFLNDKINPIS